MKRQKQNLASGFESLVLRQCCGHVTCEDILANVLQQELVHESDKVKTWPREYQWKTGIIFNKMNSNKKGQSLIHKAENLLDIICDNFDCPIFVARGFREFQKSNPMFTCTKVEKITEWKSRL